VSHAARPPLPTQLPNSTCAPLQPRRHPFSPVRRMRNFDYRKSQTSQWSEHPAEVWKIMSKNMEVFFHYLPENSTFLHFLPTASKTDRDGCGESPRQTCSRSPPLSRALPNGRCIDPKKPSQRQTPGPLAKRSTPRPTSPSTPFLKNGYKSVTKNAGRFPTEEVPLGNRLRIGRCELAEKQAAAGNSPSGSHPVRC
jgi:hypothetical protein